MKSNQIRLGTLLVAIALVMMPRASSGSEPEAIVTPVLNGAAAIAHQRELFRTGTVGEVKINVINPRAETNATVTPDALAKGGSCDIVVDEIEGTPLETDLYAALRATRVPSPRNYNILDCRIAIVFYDQDVLKSLSVFIDPKSKNAQVNGTLVHINDALSGCVLRDASKLI